MSTDLQSTESPAFPPPRMEPIGFLADKVPALAGYLIEKRLGSGGSGEVWKAVAPGGKAKAVKIIFGCLDERRAAQELKSLGRVKSLNHPFLLALESVAVVDGRVVIVTDLAEASLQDRFVECQAAGLCGIPHGELMGYLAETAEALDYLESDHGLQHLDVKPENLLLIGNHIRVADFGLLKDMTDANASLINGLTPKYAAPEVFDGRPSRWSDQYSLAIVFQEMATGTSPFSGRTAAQLASQHLHSSPDLSPLSPLERFAVGKALSKDPAMRFRNCREFVERLVPRSRTTLLTGAAPAAPASRPPLEARLVDTSIPHDGRTVEVRAPELVRLPAIPLDAAPAQHRPTVFLGIGHTGGRILTRIKQLLTER
jgi:serine/threonine protein kinase